MEGGRRRTKIEIAWVHVENRNVFYFIFYLFFFFYGFGLRKRGEVNTCISLIIFM